MSSIFISSAVQRMKSKAGSTSKEFPPGRKSKSRWKQVGKARSVVAKTAADGKGANSFCQMTSCQLWSPEHPVLYHVTLASAEDQLEDEIGFRTIETRGTEILLNGEPIFLKGINAHAEAPFRTGRAYSEKDAETLLGWVHELGGNFIRLAHYPHSERMTRLADQMGILVWSEIPVYWDCHFADPAVLSKAQSQLSGDDSPRPGQSRR